MILEIIAAYIGYKRWGGWRGALMGILYLWLIYIAVTAVIFIIFMVSGPAIEQILLDVGDSI